MSLSGIDLLQAVAERILSRYLVIGLGRADVLASPGLALGGKNVDITFAWQGNKRRVKVKPDPYFGLDAVKCHDRSMAFYRADAGAYAFEAVANSATREPGWVLESDAEEIYYYYLVIAQSEEEVRALLNEPDEVFFSELRVERDELVILPMRQTRDWFERNFERYTPRPVMAGGASAWYRLVPRTDIEASVQGITHVGSVFGLASR